MLNCPQCQSKNPENCKFCQQCGAALTHKICGECGAGVSFDRDRCGECGADARVLWWAIVKIETPSDSALESRWGDGGTFPDELPEYLDSQHRYRILPPICVRSTPSGREIQVRVSDSQPFHTPTFDPSRATLAYTRLQDRFHPTLPLLHNTWQNGDETIILLEERSHWPLLVQQWGDRQLPTLQKLDWLVKMLELWAALEVFACRQSLLELNNLRVDDNQILCMQRLYPESAASEISLRDLGQMWLFLYQQSGQTLVGDVLDLLHGMSLGKWETVAEVRAILQGVAAEYEESISEWMASDFEEELSSTLVLPTRLLALEDAAKTDRGRRRPHNEDTFEIWKQLETTDSPQGRQLSVKGLYVLCDGMGGHSGGEVASALAAKTLKEYFQGHWHDELPDEARIIEAIDLANRAIYEQNEREERYGSARMGTTLAMVLVQDTQVAIAHVGDSRIYRLKDDRGLQQMSRDHDVAQQAIRQGISPEIAYRRADADRLTQALGPLDEDAIAPEVQFLEIDDDTLFVLASDGLTDNDLLETYAETYLKPFLDPATDLEEAVEKSIELANRENGHDNITTILIRARVR